MKCNVIGTKRRTQWCNDQKKNGKRKRAVTGTSNGGAIVCKSVSLVTLSKKEKQYTLESSPHQFGDRGLVNGGKKEGEGWGGPGVQALVDAKASQDQNEENT